MNNKKRLNMFISNAVLLSVINIIMRGIAVSFNAYINRKIGAESMGLFTLVMSIYGFALTVALSCVNLGAVRLTSERCALLENSDKSSWKYSMRKVVRSVSVYSLIFGVGSGFLLYISSDVIAEFLLKDIRTVSSLKILSFSLPAISLSSGISGYFTGLRKVSKNAVAAVLEQFFKIIVTSTALVMITPGDVEAACVAVVGGAALAEAWSLIVNLFMYLTDSGKPNDIGYGEKSKKLSTKLGDVVSISLPSAIGAYARQGLSTLEHLAIPIGLRKSGLSQERALASYGLLQGIAFPLVMFPYAVIGSFTSLLVPEIAEKHELGDKEGIADITDRVYKYSAVFSCAACGIFVNFANELGVLIYDSSEAAVYTLILGCLVPFMYLDTAVDALLKGLGEQVYVMKINIYDSAAGLILVMLLTPIMGIYGYILTVWICEVGNLCASLYRLGKITGCGIVTTAKHHICPLISTVFSSVFVFLLLGSSSPLLRIPAFTVVYLIICRLIPYFMPKKIFVKSI
ncbi:MAG: polysaccharide biosynthesis protein [Ruminococcaceae bacterium]|nr:polysaccharide biosynthesis protein [Oscillospiraceae bacterium]